MSVIDERIKALRGFMAEKNMDAYIVCTDDFHGSEYVGAYFKAREYMSGFTGSAGTLVVTKDEARLWTDGRYFLQAEDQLSSSDVILMKAGQPGVPEISDYLSDTLSDGAVIGFDGRTVTNSFMSRITDKVSKKGMTYSFGEDLVDLVWADRPSLSAQPVWELFAEYTGMTRAEKLAKVRAEMEKNDAGTLVLTALDDIAWLLNLRGDDVPYNPVFLSYMAIKKDGATLYVKESILSEEIKANLAADKISVKPYNSLYDDLAGFAECGKVMVDKATANFRIVNSIPEDKIVLVASPVVIMKAVKTPEEMANERIAHIKDGRAVTHFIYWLKHNVADNVITELDAAAKLDEFRKKQDGYLGQSFDPIMGYGPHGAIIHYEPTDETNVQILPKGLLLADTGGHYYQGTTDITRTIAMGELTAEEKRMFTLVLRGHLNLAAAKFVYGVRGENLDAIARGPLWEVGLDYNHGTGHGVGYILNVHERPNGVRWRVAPNPSAVFEEGMVTSNEPGYYLAGHFGIRHENLVLCRKLEETEYGQFMGFENLTMVPFDVDAIDTDYMSQPEIDRLNAYHAQVFAAISSDFEGEELEWLKKVTAPISK